ncbi:MAG TPA: EamA family transporter [Patescibacteria group bacterium]|nr:EamA family transporter [Patescibacteria group bacterium]
MSWFYLALLAPFLYAIVNLLDDNLLQYVYEGPYIATAVAGVFSALPLVSLLFLHANHISLELGGLALLAGFLTTCYLFFYFKALGLEQPSVVIALFSLVPATLPFLAHFFLHEQLSGLEILGFVIVLAASLGLAVTDIKKFKFSAALLPILTAVILVDIISIITKHVYEHAEFYPAYMFFSAGIGIGGLYFFLIMHFNRATAGLNKFKVSVRRVLPIFILAEGIYILAELTLNLAISRGPVSIVRVIEGIQPMFVLLIALALYPLAPKFFREAAGKNLAKKFMLMAVIIGGLILINIAVKA